jgi:hypothetical protein
MASDLLDDFKRGKIDESQTIKLLGSIDPWFFHERIAEMEAEIERLKVCANCGHCRQGEEEYEGWHHWCAKMNFADVIPFSNCSFSPSAWVDREGPS